MNTLLILTGETDRKELKTLEADYVSRIKHYTPFSVDEIKTHNEGLSQAEICRREAKEIEGRLKDGDYIILLDEHGKEFTSRELAAELQKWLLYPRGRRLVFIIGGPYGFTDELKQKAAMQISLSRMTFSHQMVRLIFTEQLYRAFTIIRGEHYHHE